MITIRRVVRWNIALLLIAYWLFVFVWSVPPSVKDAVLIGGILLIVVELGFATTEWFGARARQESDRSP